MAKALGIENISASQVSEINKGLQEQVDSFRSRPLEEEYPFLWIDALYDKVRVEDRVVTLALMTAHGVNGAGNREVLAIEPMYDESEDSWRAADLICRDYEKRFPEAVRCLEDGLEDSL